MKQWLPLTGLMLAAFIFNTSEFIPIGLLSDIAADFGISESHAGMMITIYAWVVAIASLPLMLVFARTESKKLMLSIVALFVASHVLSGVSTSFNMLMLSRMGVACSHAIFWSIVTPLAVRMAPEGRSSTALGLIVSGSSFAMIVGLPLGRTIGLHVGWRTTFLIIAAVAVLVFALLAVTLRRLPDESKFSLRKLPLLLRPAAGAVWTTVLLCVFWGFAICCYNLSFQSKVMQLAPEGTAVAMSIYSGIYNVGIGAGALVGGSVCDGPGLQYVGCIGGGIALTAAIYCLAKGLPLLAGKAEPR